MDFQLSDWFTAICSSDALGKLLASWNRWCLQTNIIVYFRCRWRLLFVYTCVWPYMEINAANIARQNFFFAEKETYLVTYEKKRKCNKFSEWLANPGDTKQRIKELSKGEQSVFLKWVLHVSEEELKVARQFTRCHQWTPSESRYWSFSSLAVD